MSEASKGGDVQMTCSWERNDDFKVVKYHRQRDRDAPTEEVKLWTFEGTGDSVDKNMPEPAYSGRIDEVFQHHYLTEHKILLRHIELDDESMYWCSVEFRDGRVLRSPAELLIVPRERGKWRSLSPVSFLFSLACIGIEIYMIYNFSFQI